MTDQRVGVLPKLMAPADVRVESWIRDNRTMILDSVQQAGAVLVRGLPLRDRADAIAAIQAVVSAEMIEREGFAHREAYAPGVYSSSEWSPDQAMCMHHENSYAAIVPKILVLACVTAPEDGGTTALADASAVLDDLPAELVARFERHGWRLERSYSPMIGVSWQEAFGTDDRAEVDRYCAANDVSARWQQDGTLRTSQTRAAIAVHPDTAYRTWFNQVAFLNEWTMEPEVRDYLVELLGPQGLPFNTYCGDGSPLDRATVDLINAVYERHTIREPWQRGDLMVVDNIRVAHSREPYHGAREIVVGFGEPLRR